MRISDLNRRVLIQQRSTTKDSFGQQSTAWTDLLTCWAHIEPLSGRELVNAQAVNAEVTHTVTIRYRSNVTASMRVLYQGRIFNITAVIDPDTSHVWTSLNCSEGLNLG